MLRTKQPRCCAGWGRGGMAKIQLPEYIAIEQVGSNILVQVNTSCPQFLLWLFKEAVRQSRELRLAISLGRFKVSLPAWPIVLPIVLKHIWQLARTKQPLRKDNMPICA